MNNQSTNLIISILIVVVVVGFYLVLTNIQENENKISQVSSNIEKSLGDKTVTPSNKATSTASENQGNETSSGVSIPTAILFEAKSSPLLEPQTDLTITVEEITKLENGQVNLAVKVYTNNAESYSAMQPSNLFELVRLSGENQKPLKAKGSFDSIPPQSATTGQITFKVNEDTNEVILQIQSNDGITHYRFNFENKTYEEAILG